MSTYETLVQKAWQEILTKLQNLPRYKIVRVPRLSPPSPVIPPTGNTGQGALNVRYSLDYFWCDKYGMYFEGWILGLESPLRRFIITIGEDSQEITRFSPRADLLQLYPGHPDVSKAGFGEFIPSRPGEKVSFTVETAAGSQTMPVQFPQLSLPKTDAPREEGYAAAYLTFIREVNDRRLSVLEIGSRLVMPESTNHRQVLHNASRYVGMDIHPAPNVDVVGDAHFLSEIVGVASFDAVFSLSVLEHMPYPWLLAKEINRVLKIGGLVFHNTHQAWPVHEQPNDFWRFSDEGLKVLFGPNTGFEVIHANLTNTIYMHSDEGRHDAFARLPLHPAFGGAMILSRKVRDIDPDSIRWPVTMTGSRERAIQYPVRDGLTSSGSAKGGES